jgi:hypothetical protein
MTLEAFDVTTRHASSRMRRREIDTAIMLWKDT